MEQTKKFNYGWLIIIGLCFNSLTTWQLTGSITSIFATPVVKALALDGKAVFMMWMTFQSLAGLVAGPLWGWLLQSKKVNIKFIMLLGVVCNGGACFIFAMAPSIEYFYVAGLLIGFAQCGVNNVAFPYFTSNWVAGRIRGTLLSVVSCMAGVGGFIWPLVIQSIVNVSGWQIGYWACGIIMLVLTIPWCLVYVRTPEEKGLKPLGYKEGISEAEKADVDVSRGVNFKKIMTTAPFWFLLVAALLLAIFGGYKSNINGLAEESLLATQWAADAAMIGAFCLSVNAIADLVGNLTLGPLCDRFGSTVPTLIWIVIAMFAPISWLFLAGSPYGLYVAAICFGIHGSILKVGMPLILRKVYGPKDFGKAYGYFATAKVVVSGFAATIVALFSDITGTYAGALYLGIAVAVIVGILVTLANRSIGKFDWQHKDYSEAIVQ
jgi:MFS family permease